MLKQFAISGLIGAIAVLPCTLQAAESAPERANTEAQKTLDLKAPEIGKIFSLDQINAVLARAVDPALEFIEVEALRLGDLPLDDNSAAPAQRLARTVWWLFAPQESTATFQARVNQPPDATDPQRPAPFVQTNYHASFDQP